VVVDDNTGDSDPYRLECNRWKFECGCQTIGDSLDVIQPVKFSIKQSKKVPRSRVSTILPLGPED
jgi:hypothetical protein